MRKSKEEIIEVVESLNAQIIKLKALIPDLEIREKELKLFEQNITNAVDTRTSAERTIQNVLRADIIDLKQHEFALSNALELANDIIKTVHEPLIILDKNLSVIFANKSFYTTFRVKESETENKKIFDLGNKQWDIPQLREMLNDIILKSTSFEKFEVKHCFPKLGQKTMILNARKINRRLGDHYILLAIENESK